MARLSAARRAGVLWSSARLQGLKAQSNANDGLEPPQPRASYWSTRHWFWRPVAARTTFEIISRLYDGNSTVSFSARVVVKRCLLSIGVVDGIEQQQR